MSNPTALVQKLWNYCNILRDDGLSYGDYVEQLTFLLFLKMADEQSRPPFSELKPRRDAAATVPKEFTWPSLRARDGDELETHYRHVLESLGKQKGMLGVIFRKAQNKIQDPAKLRRLIVDLIDKEQWSSLSADVKGDAYEGLLQKNAEDVKGGAGQYFTPRPLIAAIVDAVSPQPGQTICDPACGTGGFLLAAHDFIARMPGLDKAQKKRLKNGTLFGIELVDSVTRLCAMNLLLHGIGDDVGPMPSSGGKDAASGDAAYNLPVVTKDALAGKHDEYDIVLANPPFGKKSSATIMNEAGEQSKEPLIINRDECPLMRSRRVLAGRSRLRASRVANWASTSNKQLNFLQHIFTILKQHGRAAGVLPDNVLFEGGAGETIRRELPRACLKIPSGAVFVERAGWRGATKENTPGGSSTEKQRSQAAFSAKTLRAAGLSARGFVVAGVTARCGDAPPAPSRPKSKSFAAAPLAIFRQALKQADVHTLLRLPAGIFYAQGVKANVLFFDRKPAQEKPWTQKLWIYDLRTNKHFTLKESTLKRADLDEFVNCYFGRTKSTPHPNPLPGRGGEGGASRHKRTESERFKSFTYDELLKRDKVNLDIFWQKDEALEKSANLPAPEAIAQEISDDLETALEQFATIAKDLK